MANQFAGRRYEIHGMLGRGGMGAVYRATDRVTGEPVALKRVLTTSEELLSTAATDASSISVRVALAHEFQTLASLRHPHIIPVLDYGFDEDKQPFFTMTLLAAPQPFTRYATSQSSLATVQLLVQMLQALAYLHRRGIAHCDLKPDNALVTVDDGVQVLDFGLAILMEQRRTEENEILGGTLAYMAPEVMQGMPPSAAADLYAVGVMAYELFAGRHPFESETVGQLISRSLFEEPDLSQLDVEPELAVIIGRLLAKEPGDRYPDAYAVIDLLSEAVQQPIPKETAAIRESYLQAAKFVGRESEVSQLRAALQMTLDGSGSSWLIAGETGVGKSRLLEELRIRALVQGTPVVRGQAVSGGGLPYQLWRDPLRRIVLALDLDDLDAGILRELVPDIEHLLGRSIPAAVTLEGLTHQRRLVGTIVSLIRRYARLQPVLLLLEDLQWTDESLLVLDALNNLVKDLPLMIVATYRPEERAYLHEELASMRLLRVDRLSPEAITELTVSIMGEAGYLPALQKLLIEETQGNVFFLIEVVRSLAEEVGRLGDIGRMSVPRQVIAGGITQAITRRLGRVPAEARTLLYLAAAAGRDLDLKVIRHLAGSDDLDNWLAICSNCAVLEVQDSRWRFPYDRLRETLLTELDESARAAHHQQVAQAIEAVYGDVPEQAGVLAAHWRAAGNATKELYYTRRAGENALRLSALADAVLYFRRALDLLPGSVDTPDETRAGLLVKLGEALKYTGDYTAAATCLQDALTSYEALHDDNGIALALLGLGDVVSFQGDSERAVALSEQALARYRDLEAQRGIARSTSQLGRLLMQRGEYPGAIQYCEESLAISRRLHDVEGIAVTINNLGTVAFRQGDTASARRYFEETLSMARASGERRQVAAASMNIGSVCGVEEDFASATRYFEEALSIGREIGERRIVSMSVSNLGHLAGLQQDYFQATLYLQESYEQAEAMGNKGGMAEALVNLGHVTRSLEQFPEAASHYHRTLELAREINDLPTLLEALTGLAEIVDDAGQALGWLGFIQENPAGTKETRQMAAGVIAALGERAALDEAERQRLLSAGAALSLDQVLSEALASHASAS